MCFTSTFSVPVILRKYRDNVLQGPSTVHALIGGCYIGNYMTGEFESSGLDLDLQLSYFVVPPIDNFWLATHPSKDGSIESVLQYSNKRSSGLKPDDNSATTTSEQKTFGLKSRPARYDMFINGVRLRWTCVSHSMFHTKHYYSLELIYLG